MLSENILEDSPGKNSFYFSQEISFSYLGERDYIDISSINNVVESCVLQISPIPWSYASYRILRPLTSQGFIRLVSEKGQIVATKDSAVRLTLTTDQTYYGFIDRNSATDRKMTDEPNFNLDDFLYFKNNRAVLIKRFNDDYIYNLMKIGKALIIKSIGKMNPRVIFTQLTVRPEPNDFDKLSMSIEYFKHQMYKLNIYLFEKPVGIVIVKAAS